VGSRRGVHAAQGPASPLLLPGALANGRHRSRVGLTPACLRCADPTKLREVGWTDSGSRVAEVRVEIREALGRADIEPGAGVEFAAHATGAEC
jgi:hypothetical protein